MPNICPKCRENLDSVPMQDGKLRCPECGTVLTVKRSDERTQAAPRGKPRGVRTPKSSALPTVLIVLGVVAASFVVLGAGIGLGVYFYLNRTTPTTPGADVAQGNNPGAVTRPGLPPQRNPRAAPKRQSNSPPNAIAVGKPAPEIEAEDIDGTKFKLSDYRGKVVLLDFWGHW